MRKWLIVILIILVYPFTSYSDVAGPFNLSVKQDNTSPLSHINTLVYDHNDGFTVFNLGTGKVRLNLTLTDNMVPDTITASNYCALGGDTLCTMTGNLRIGNQKTLRFYEDQANGTNYQALSAPASLAADSTFRLNINLATCTGDPNGGKLTADSGGNIICSPDSGGAGGGSVTVKETDNVPSVSSVTTLKFDSSYFSLTDNGSGVITASMFAFPWNMLTGVPAFRKTLFQIRPRAYFPPSTNFARIDSRNGHPILNFNTSTSECGFWDGTLPSWYGSNGVTVTLCSIAPTLTSGTVEWDVYFEKLASQDIDSDGFTASPQSTAATSVNATSGIQTCQTVAFTDGAQMDSVGAGDDFRLKICRNVAGDSLAEDASLLEGNIAETP